MASTEPFPWARVGKWVGIAAGGLALTALISNRVSSSASAPRLVSGRLPGTIFTIVFENKGRRQVLDNASAPTFRALARQYIDLQNYRPGLHPSLPNYIAMVSGGPQGITDDVGHVISGTEHLAAQMDAAGIPWRAYAESMPAPCSRHGTNLFMVRHVPFLYFQSVIGQPSCAQNVVPMTPIWNDLATDRLKFVFITPNACNDAHDCPISTADAWLAQVLPRLMNTPGYRRGGAIFILFDETEGLERQIPAILISPLAKNQGSAVTTLYDHRSYLATLQDLLGVPRLPLTQGITSMTNLLR